MAADPAGDRASVPVPADRDGTAAAQTAVGGAEDPAGSDVAGDPAGSIPATPAAGVGTAAPAAAMSADNITPAPSPEVPSPAEPAALAENTDTPDLTPCAALP